VLKLHSLTITHKTDVGGIQLNLPDAAAVRGAFDSIRSGVTGKAGAQHFQGVTVQPMVKLKDAYELIIGSSIDPQFGPVLLFGTGGQLVEVFKDRALALPPLTGTLARRLMEQTKIFTALKGVRGRKPVDLAALERLLVQFSLLVVEQPWIREIDINPLLASGDGLIALDARVLVHGKGVTPEQLPRPAIRPYPTQYVTSLALRDNTPIMIRPIRPDDEPAMVRFHEALSERTVHLRYFAPLKLSRRVAHDRLTRIVFTDYDREMVMVVERVGVRPEHREILGVGRLSKQPGSDEAEFALLISDQWQRRGLGTQLLSHLLTVARAERVPRVTATILGENREMQHLAKKLGFTLTHDERDGTVRAEITLDA
jgi:acetyltransferase